MLGQLSVLYGAGVPVVQAMEIAAFPEGIIKNVREGSSVSEAFSGMFCRKTIPVIRVGELTGELSRAFRSAADAVEADLEFSGAIKKSLAYPAMVLAVCVASMLFFSLSIVPQISTLFLSMDVKVPFFVSLLSGLPAFMAVLASAVLLLAVSWAALARKGILERQREGAFFLAPLAGRLIRKSKNAKIAEMLSLLLGAGVPLKDAFVETASSETSVLFREALERVTTDIESGQALSAALKKEPLFEEMLCRAVSAGEGTGRTDSILKGISVNMMQEVKESIGALVLVIEPAATVAVGLFAGLIAAAMMSPITSILSSI